MRLKNSSFFLIAILFLSSFSTYAQETSDVTIVDQVVAQVNESVVTLSQINREIKTAVEAMRAQGKKRNEAQAIVDGRRGELIASLITEELLIQKGKEIGIEKAVEAEVNRRLIEQKDRFKLKTIEELFTLMKQQGIDPEDVKASWRRQITQDFVLRSQVDEPLYWNISDKEIKTYFNANQTKFIKPATVTISEIFLSFAGRDKEATKKKAMEIVKRARNGEDFVQLVMENSDRPDAAVGKGKAGTWKVPELRPEFAKGLKGVKVGGITDPIEMEIGMEILKVDARTKASTQANFDERAVRTAILYEKLPNARKKFMTELKDDAYIKVHKNYQALVMPHLEDKKDDKTASANK